MMNPRTCALFVALIAIATTSLADPVPEVAKPNAQKHFVSPSWIRIPTREDMLRVWPPAALAKGESGFATISCTTTRLGTLRDCKVVGESPEGSGFGEAAIGLTPQFLMKPGTIDGKAIEGGTIKIPIRFAAAPPGMESVGRGRVVLTVRAWTSAPSMSQVLAAFPKEIQKANVTGQVTITCTIGEGGLLKSCSELTVFPRNMGLFTAANLLSKYFIAPTEFEGKSTKGMITQIPFVFDPSMLNSVEPVVGKPDWLATPTVAQIQGVLPKDTHGAQTVRARIRCAVIAGGLVEGCKVLSEDPPGLGLGEALLTLSPNFRLSTWSQDGLPIVGGQVTIPLRYDTAPTKTAQAPAAVPKP